MSVIDEYLTTVTPEQKAELERVRKIIKDTAPDAEEAMSYGMPSFNYKGKYLASFAVFKKHMSLFPGTLKFTVAEPLPESVIKGVIEERMKAISAA